MFGPMPFEFDLAFPVLKTHGDRVQDLQLHRRRLVVRQRVRSDHRAGSSAVDGRGRSRVARTPSTSLSLEFVAEPEAQVCRLPACSKIRNERSLERWVT